MYNKLCIKLGSNLLARKDGSLDTERIDHIVDQIAILHQQGKETILVSSGAVASGRNLIKTPALNDAISRRQLWSSIGQIQLMNAYINAFQRHQIMCAQVLVTKGDFKDRHHYLNMKNCISSLLANKVVPIVNENDAVSVTELMFTDNDELAGLIAGMTNAEVIIILSDIDGIYDGDPDESGVSVIPEIHNNLEDYTRIISSKKSNFGKGGIITKSKIANRAAKSGITSYIANGQRDNILLDLLNDDRSVLNTKFVAGKRTSNVKKWIAHSEGFEKGIVYVNTGAKNALLSKMATSLLFIGITRIEGYFKKGDIVKIMDEEGNYLGLGRVKYDAEMALNYIGKENKKPFIHYDYLFLNN
ncbi:glutamate 5-kinase [Bacteroidota bacterium]